MRHQCRVPCPGRELCVRMQPARIHRQSLRGLPSRMCWQLRMSCQPGLHPQQVPEPMPWSLWTGGYLQHQQPHSHLLLPSWIHRQCLRPVSTSTDSTSTIGSLLPLALRPQLHLPRAEREGGMRMSARILWKSAGPGLPTGVYSELRLCQGSGLHQLQVRGCLRRRMRIRSHLPDHQPQPGVQLSCQHGGQSIRPVRDSSPGGASGSLPAVTVSQQRNLSRPQRSCHLQLSGVCDQRRLLQGQDMC